MNISIDARGINLYSGTGIGTYTYNLVKQLISIDKKHNYTLFWSGERNPLFQKSNSKLVFCSKKHGKFYEEEYIRRYIENNYKLHHIPQNGIGLTDSYLCPTIVTIHDLIPYTMPETVGAGYLERFLENMPKIIEKSEAIITVSEYSKKDICRFFPKFPKEKIFVTPLAANDSFKPLNKLYCLKYLNDNYSINSPYILYIGGFSSRKNVQGLIKAFHSVSKSLPKDYLLVICGELKDEGLYIQSLVNTLGLKDKVVFTGYIPDNILPIFYNGASVFVYPSLYEGFGLPPLEAMKCATPVITSNLTSIPEVTGNSALLFNPYNFNELSNCIYKVLSDEDLANSLASKGYKKSLQFSWRQTAKLTINAYKSIINAK